MTKRRTSQNSLARRRPAASGPSQRASTGVIVGDEVRFAEVVAIIEAARGRAYQAVNTELVSLYWQLGEYISRKIASAEWGDGVVEELAASLARRFPGLRGFTRRNLFRMRQFFEAYRGHKRVSPLVTRLHPTALDEFKNVYNLEFLSLPDGHSEADLHGALLRHLGRFLTELGRDFCFVGSQYPVQVGNQDFAVDLVFFHRGLQCLVAIELKVDKFKPADLGQLSFYVEALDRDVRKEHERPSIGVLLCATKDYEVVEYALARTASPTLVAEYQTFLPSKPLLRAKLHELYAQLAPGDGKPGPDAERSHRVKRSSTKRWRRS